MMVQYLSWRLSSQVRIVLDEIFGKDIKMNNYSYSSSFKSKIKEILQNTEKESYVQKRMVLYGMR